MLLCSVGVLYTGYTNAWPSEAVSQLADNGLDLTGRNEDGYTVRDNILVQVCKITGMFNTVI